MFTVLGKVSVEDLPKFIGVFSTHGAGMRRKHHSTGSQVFRVQGEANEV